METAELSPVDSLVVDMLSAHQLGNEYPDPDPSKATYAELRSNADLRTKIAADPESAFAALKRLPATAWHICQPFVQEVLSQRPQEVTVH